MSNLGLAPLKKLNHKTNISMQYSHKFFRSIVSKSSHYGKASKILSEQKISVSLQRRVSKMMISP